ncbi:AbrB/MazE/SpoVT family DNA-binding domain-containing protein [Photorhabdus bodei]|uniref:AbrB/MazE/SpoVT family DNA-binding domain-containing protein n=1 Tax=Photorhabdus bodei TaxID=2029681 RepID=A0A329X3X0_9GAMM|nr:AbrB/MazE/SpoVT family DNA-binding domain-containing protein [Photorhabdus bodei]NDL00150.1 AbrB/MazE/SpoVT family DNA-binding domain-containing protein [Photorhabdus bodei]NDL04285.1 AbrB/MazE/SpoVT family DNA-binding domain-containing protein [Photorhabdus bodei]NDL08566.1 AbrB/MazE/SpoVT family DNA-binding domain-containing protein [Photorhabdus bodei]RAX10033.1 antitoxin ChpS [Photorhabdus bodei]
MTITIKKWGNSSGIVIPAVYLKQIGVKVGHELDIEVKGGSLLLKPVSRNYTLAELIAKCDPSSPMETEESIWGTDNAVGNEVW